MKMLQNLLSFIMDYFDRRMEDGNFMRQIEKCLTSRLKKKKLKSHYKDSRRPFF